MIVAIGAVIGAVLAVIAAPVLIHAAFWWRDKVEDWFTGRRSE